MEHQKKLFLVPLVIWCYHSNEFVTEYLKFSEVIVTYVSFKRNIKNFKIKVKFELISETITQKYLLIANFSQISEKVWELRVSKICAYASAKIQIMTS